MSETVDIFAVGDAADSARPRRRSRYEPVRPGTAALGTDLQERTQVHSDDREPLLHVRVVELGSGPFGFEWLVRRQEACLGVLVLDGLLLVQLEAGRGHVGWLVGEGDVLRPWELPEISLTSRTRWQALEQARIALLEDVFTRDPRAAAFVPAVVSRSANTAHWLLAKSLIISCPTLEDRLMLLFALLGERWGKVTVDGILVDLPLTHGVLATLCGARRPSVTLALGELRKGGVLARAASGGWLLTHLSGDEPAAQLSSWRTYAEALGLA